MMISNRRILPALCLLPLIAWSPTSSIHGGNQDEDAVRAADLGMARAVGARDVEAFKSFIAADGVWIGSGLSRGPAGAAKAWAVFFNPQTGTSIDWSPEEITVAASGDLAFSIGGWTMTQEVRGEAQVMSTGTYFTVWRKNAAGRWLVAADGSLSARDPLPPGFDLEPLRTLAAGFTPLASPDAHVIHERHPELVVHSEAGDLAYAFGEYVIRVEDADGARHRAAGAYFTVWTKGEREPWRAVAESMTAPKRQSSTEDK